MNKEERLKLYEEAINRWGVVAQTDMAFEECGELIAALAKDKRGRMTKEELLTELADVTVMCEQLGYILGFDDYEKELNRKLIRLRDEKLKLNGDN